MTFRFTSLGCCCCPIVGIISCLSPASYPRYPSITPNGCSLYDQHVISWGLLLGDDPPSPGTFTVQDAKVAASLYLYGGLTETSLYCEGDVLPKDNFREEIPVSSYSTLNADDIVTCFEDNLLPLNPSITSLFIQINNDPGEYEIVQDAMDQIIDVYEIDVNWINHNATRPWVDAFNYTLQVGGCNWRGKTFT